MHRTEQLEGDVVKAGLSVVGKAVDGSGLVHSRLDASACDVGALGLARSHGGGLEWLAWGLVRARGTGQPTRTAVRS